MLSLAHSSLTFGCCQAHQSLQVSAGSMALGFGFFLFTLSTFLPSLPQKNPIRSCGCVSRPWGVCRDGAEVEFLALGLGGGGHSWVEVDSHESELCLSLHRQHQHHPLSHSHTKSHPLEPHSSSSQLSLPWLWV